MSGIAGIFNTDGRPVNGEALDRMVEALAHRGPDGRGAWLEGPAGLGHRMFHETPESLHERQPCVDQAAQLVLTADARIDNREDLIRQLDLAAEDPLLLPDSRLILLAYARWGEDCAERLIGDFAFALWDGRRRSLFCARDYIGVKPFYYTYRNNRFLFASELKGILCLDDVPRELNEEMIASYLATDFEDKEITFYQGLFRLPPAHTMRLDKQGFRLRCYWQPDPVTELRLKSDTEYAEAFREVFAEAVRCRLRSAFPVASMLSGGMDSSSITCMARDLLAREGRGRTLKTFSATYDHLSNNKRINERRYQDSVIAMGGIEPHAVSMKEFGPLEAYLEGQRGMDFPYIGWTHYLDRGLFPRVRDEGARIILVGQGGDDVVQHGYELLPYLAKNLQLRRFYRESRALAQTQGVPIFRVLWRSGLRQRIPPLLLFLWHLARYRKAPTKTPLLSNLAISPNLLRSTRIFERAREQEDSAKQPSTLRQVHAKAFTMGLVAFVFEMCDQLYYDFSLVGRFPFYDRRVAEFCLSLPADQKLSEGWTRIVLRRAMEGILPVENQWRPGKADLSPHIDFKLQGQERQLLIQTLERVSPLIADYVDVNKLREICERYGHSSQPEDLFMSFWPAICLGVFMMKDSFHSANREEVNRTKLELTA